MKKFILSISAVASLVIILSSCNVNDSGTTQPQLGAFLVAQISPDAQPLSVYINNEGFDTGMVFGNYTPYVTANPGTYTFTVFASGASTPALNNTINLEANKYYSYFIIDSFNKVKSSLVSDVFKAPAGDSAYVRFFNFCPNTTEPLSLTDSSGTALFASRTFNDQSVNPQYATFNEVLSRTYLFNLKSASGAVLKTQSITLTGGKVYTLFAKGIQGSSDTTKALSIGLLENYPQR